MVYISFSGDPTHRGLGAHRQEEIRVDWRPPQGFLHYRALDRGVHEFVREPPRYLRVPRVVRYLRRLEACCAPGNTLQQHRILWVRAWLEAVETPSDSDAETVVSEE
jgi:hypothetical protein